MSVKNKPFLLGRTFPISASIGMALLLSQAILPSTAAAEEFRIGAARADITGPAGGIGMLGYGDLSQTTSGIHSRLYSRAFVIETSEGATAKRIAFVSADLSFITQSVKLTVIERLASLLPGLYSHENVMITATHTHSGPGGFSDFTLFNITTLGESQQNFEAIVSGIVRSIQAAHEQRTPAHLYYSAGRLDGATLNRSVAAFLANPGAAIERDQTNKLMTVLKAVSENREIGMVNWFSAHATTMSKHSRLISSDNKGYASFQFEKRRAPGFVAAFANSDEGDSSPAIYNSRWERKYADFDSVEVSGEAHYQRALELYDSASEPLDPVVDYRHVWVKMPGYQVKDEFTGSGDQTLCRAAMGYSFAAGAEDGPSEVRGFHEGMTQGDGTHGFQTPDPLQWLYRALGIAALGVTAEDEACHYPKPILVGSGNQTPVWSPETLPFQLFRIGNLALIAVPGEMTTMAGQRLRRLVLERLSPIGVTRAVIAGLANTYSDYITTRAEYEQQHYEGASTLYGPHTFAAYLQVFSDLAKQLVLHETRPISPTPARLTGGKINLQPKNIFDDKRLWESFGGALGKPRAEYSPGDEVILTFRSANPSNDLLTEDTFVEVQRRTGSQWSTLAQDNDPAVLFEWNLPKLPDCLACSDAKITWKIPRDAACGTYRIVHNGAQKGLGGIRRFQGASDTFTISCRH